ncbi:hypothetical protein GPJ56_003534 [Histomonas meleagridis]|uniref:uncharacterized protein n=1 Tax=Histomonas meleagridis TaxID=135588 RepID=UPI00355A0E0E|nr:hypothetical protein GPJ56_003534 [Histomonas meleagridis]KAH0806420.1 hypothetical protein GO595_000795 [Histomonas meleagridis]
MTLNSYSSDKFCNLNAFKGTTIEGCNGYITYTFSKSNTFTYTQSNTFTQSNAFTVSNTFTKSNAFTTSSTYTNLTLTFTLTITHTLSRVISLLNSFTLTQHGSDYAHITTYFIYYEYTVIIYTFYISFYTDFFTIMYTSETTASALTQTELIGIICGAIAFVLVIVGVVIFIIKRKKPHQSEEIIEDEISSMNEQKELIDEDVHELVKHEDDKWLLDDKI